jgi:hypothetical protein
MKTSARELLRKTIGIKRLIALLIFLMPLYYYKMNHRFRHLVWFKKERSGVI